MTAVTVIVDSSRLLPEHPDALCVDAPAGYPAAWLAIRAALQSSRPLTVLVHDRAVAAWFEHAAAIYGEAHIRFQRYTVRHALQERWQVAIPAEISDDDLLRSSLLDLALAPRAGQSFWDTLLEYFFGPAATYSTFPAAAFATLLNDVGSDRWQDGIRRPLVLRAWRDLLGEWEARAINEATRTLIRRLRSASESLRRDMIAYKLLRRYPAELGMRVLSSEWDTIRKVNPALDALDVQSDALRDILPQIEYYLTATSVQVQNRADLLALLEQMSGYLVEEFQVIENLAQAHPEWIDRQAVQQIEHRFSPIRERIASRLDYLRRLSPPPYPSEPDPDWSAGQWLDWIAGEYMPYYAWLDQHNRHDEMVAGYACRFADWFYDQYIELKNGQPHHFAFSTLFTERERMLADGTITLVLIVDNLNLAYYADLQHLLNRQGFGMQITRPVFSLIPTATEVGKAVLIANTGDRRDINLDRFPDLVSRHWGAQATYLPNIGELQRITELQHTIYFLNYLVVDDELHKDARETGRSHAEAIHAALLTLVRTVAEFARRFQIEQRLQIYILSDHGSTRIAGDAINVLDPAFYAGLALDKHHRYLALSDAQFDGLPQVAAAQCYPINRHRFRTNRHYLAARGYYRFRDTSEHFYVHGGLTPEEVVVPFARYTCLPVRPLPPTLRLPVTQFRYQIKSTVTLELGNPNSFPLEAVGVRLAGMDAEEVFLPLLPPKQTMEVQIPAIFRRIPGEGDSRTLMAQISYECQDSAFPPVEFAVPITLKSMMEVKHDDFDF